MNKFSMYVLLILVFLGLSKNFSPSSQKSIFVQNEQVLSALIPDAPISLILVDLFDAGFIIKTYYLKLKVIHGFKSDETIMVRTTHKFWKKNFDNIGMSLFRRFERDLAESTVPMPPGSLFIGNRAFGRWRYQNSGRRVWKFYKVYRHFPKSFSWGDYRPDYDFYKAMQIHLTNETPFYGTNNEFGTNGLITKKVGMANSLRKKQESITFVNHLKRYVSIPRWKRSAQEPKVQP